MDYCVEYKVTGHFGSKTFRPKCPHISPVHTSNNVEATLSNATSRTILSTKS